MNVEKHYYSRDVVFRHYSLIVDKIIQRGLINYPHVIHSRWITFLSTTVIQSENIIIISNKSKLCNG